MPYSATADLLTGNVPAGGNNTPLSPQKFVDDAADEIDSAIGHIYQTPVDVTEQSATTRPARLLLKRISNWLASGRLLMAAAAGSQKQEVNAYANKLVTDAMEALAAIASGDVPLTGAVRVDDPDQESFTGPQISNLDAESNVEAFYNRIANPRYVFTPAYPFGSGDGLVR